MVFFFFSPSPPLPPVSATVVVAQVSDKILAGPEKAPMALQLLLSFCVVAGLSLSSPFYRHARRLFVGA